MNKIVKEHYPASKLPVELREGIEASALVTVIIQEEGERRKPLTREQLRELIEQSQQESKGGTIEDAVARVRALRDEWDD
ncbi:MAG: hypothetical protein ACXWVI_09670 [Methyloceanibacter sp.]|jgi:hypothetical protein